MSKTNFKVTEIGYGSEAITILTAQTLHPRFTSVYRNIDTRSLDQIFGLDHTTIIAGSSRQDRLYRSVELSALGDTYVERLLWYFVTQAHNYRIFVGLPESELRAKIERDEGGLQTRSGIRSRFIDLALAHRNQIDIGGLVQPVSYLKRIAVKGIEVLFPTNLRG